MHLEVPRSCSESRALLADSACRGILLRRDIEDATLFRDVSRVLQRVIDMVQINCEHWAAIEIGNERHAAKVIPPKRTPFQIASLKAKVKADRTGQMVPIITNNKFSPEDRQGTETTRQHALTLARGFPARRTRRLKPRPLSNGSTRASTSRTG